MSVTDIANPVTVTDEYLRNNAAYARDFHGPLPLPPAKHIAVVACMDARLTCIGFWACTKASRT